MNFLLSLMASAMGFLLGVCLFYSFRLLGVVVGVWPAEWGFPSMVLGLAWGVIGICAARPAIGKISS